MRGGKREGSGRKSIGDKKVKVLIDEKTLEKVETEFDGNSNSEKLRNCIKYGVCNKKGLRVATVFSGVGAIEHALYRMKINHEIIFASDNGGCNIFERAVNHNFYSIEDEIREIEEIIKVIDGVEHDQFYRKLVDDLERVELNYQGVKTQIINSTYNERIKESVDKIWTQLDKEQQEKLNKNINSEIRDASDYNILLIELRKTLKGKSEYSNILEFFNAVELDKNFRKNMRAIKEITKLLSQLHESIGTFKTSIELGHCHNFEEKKKHVDQLYKKYENSNAVKKVYFDNYKIDPKHYHWNVCFIDGNQYKDKVDLYVGGSPCQSFSIVGKRGGFEDTRGTLFYEYVRILKEVEPRFFIYENVKGVLSHDNGRTWDTMKNTFSETGYFLNEEPYILNSRDFGVPQNRERLFVIGFKYKEDYDRFETPKVKPLETTMYDLLEDFVDDKYFLPEKGIKFVTDFKNIDKKYTQINGDVALCQKANQQFNWHGDFVEHYTKDEMDRMSKIDDKYFLSDKVKKYILDDVFYMNRKENEELIDLVVARPLTATMHKMHRAGVDNYISYGKKLKAEDRRIRKLTPRECFRIMGFSDSFNLTVSDTQLYHQAGNSIVVDVLVSIMDEIIKIY